MNKEEQQKKIEQVIRKFKDILVFQFGISKTALALDTNVKAMNMDKFDLVSLFRELDRQFSTHTLLQEVYGCVHMPIRNIVNILNKNLIATQQLTPIEAEMVINQFDKVSPSTERPQIVKSEPVKMVSVPKSLIDEYIKTADKLQMLTAQLKQYQK